MDTVLIDPFFPAIQKLLDAKTLEQWRSLRDPAAFYAFEKGEISEREYFRTFYRTGKLPSHIPSVPKLKKHMFSQVHFRPGMEKLLQSLSSRTDLALGIASNYSSWYHTVLSRRPELENWFEFLFFSCELGLRKPDPAYYRAIHESLGESFASIHFFDDRKDNLMPCQDLGWSSVEIALRTSNPEDAEKVTEEILAPLRLAGIL
ncbi:MAG: HAD-IA family hydrolase [Leptospiraceae bacterium]|nr:HAD-IA family hydrolase [Leptospiraceae bacterium]